MKQITFYSTCQGLGIKNYIQYYFSNNDNFDIIRNYSLVLGNHELSNFRKILKKTNIFIYQEMPSKWNEYSTNSNVTNNILTYLPNDCIKIIIPYVYADWLWGLNKILLRDGTTNFDKIDQDTEKKKKYINKEVIINMKNKGLSLNNILKLYDDNKINFKYEERKYKGINILKSKEKTCDVKVSDFILENYKKEKLFYMPNHPTRIILKEMSKQILKKIKY